MSYNKKMHRQMVRDENFLNLQCKSDVEIYDEAEFDRILGEIQSQGETVYRSGISSTKSKFE